MCNGKLYELWREKGGMTVFPAAVEQVLTRLEEAGYEAYVVGGCVRDLLRGKSPDDWDMTTAARPEEVMALFAPHAIPTGLQHGTVTVRQDGQSFEVTTFRADGVYTDHRHPDEVRFSTDIREDLCRRDFTVNAMAMDRRGKLIDPFGGQADLRSGIIRCVGESDRRFGEDALRIMRGLRFAAVLGFAIDDDTAQSIRKNRERLQNIAIERILVEMDKLLCGEDTGRILLDFPEVFSAFLPEILPCVDFDQCSQYHCYTVWEHIVRSVESIAPVPVLRWVMLLHDIGKPGCFTVDEQGTGHFYGHDGVSGDMAADICRRLRMDKQRSTRIELLVRRHGPNLPDTKRGMLRLLNAIGEEAVRQLIAVKRADNMAQSVEFRDRQRDIAASERLLEEVLAEQPCVTLRQLAVNGQDMMALGLQGRAIGEMLQTLLHKVWNEELPNEHEPLLRWVEAQRGRNTAG